MNKILSVQATYPSKTTGNPLLDALPPQLSLSELYNHLANVPKLKSNYTSLSSQARFKMAEDIKKIYVPLEFAAYIYNSFYSGIRSTYQGKTIKSVIQRLNQTGKLIANKTPDKLDDSITQAECFSIIGESGMGKTATVTKILDLFPQVIYHTEYDGKPFQHEQIVYIKIESPANNSLRGVCLQVLAAIDEVLGTDYCGEERRKSTNVDMQITKISQLCTKFSIGCIVIDEIQNVLTASDKMIRVTGNKMVNFLVELANKTGVCLVFVGTPQIAPLFDSEPHLARRTRGPRIPELKPGDSFNAVLKYMWDTAPVLLPMPISDKIQDTVYRISGGVIAKMQSLILLSAQHAVYFGEETITSELLIKVAKQYNIVPGKSMFQAPAPELLKIPAPSKKRVPVNRKGKGRPKAQRDDNDILLVFSECQKHGWSVTKALIQRGLAERGVDNND